MSSPTAAQLAARLARTQREYADAARRAIREVDRYGMASERCAADIERCRAAVRMAREAIDAADGTVPAPRASYREAAAVAVSPSHLGESS